MERSAVLFRAWQAKLAGPALPSHAAEQGADDGKAAAGREYRREQDRVEPSFLRGEAERAVPALMQREPPDAEQVRRRMRAVLESGPTGSGPLPAQGVAGVYEGQPALTGNMAQVLVSGWQQDDAANGSAALARQMQEAQEQQSLLAMSDRFERDARRYDGGFLLY